MLCWLRTLNPGAPAIGAMPTAVPPQLLLPPPPKPKPPPPLLLLQPKTPWKSLSVPTTKLFHCQLYPHVPPTRKFVLRRVGMRLPAAAAAAVETVGKPTAPKSVAVVVTLFEFVQMPPPLTPI
jgi:hypothetical protein